MSEEKADSLERLLEDLDRAATCHNAADAACLYFYGKIDGCDCNGCRALEGETCSKKMLAEFASRLHALMPRDADGREIRARDTIEGPGGKWARVVDVLPAPATVRDGREGITTFAMPTLWRVVEPDSWERLEEDAEILSPYQYCMKRCGGEDKVLSDGSRMAQDILRRAKALAGVE